MNITGPVLVTITGPMAAGKTQTGRLLEEQLKSQGVQVKYFQSRRDLNIYEDRNGKLFLGVIILDGDR